MAIHHYTFVDKFIVACDAFTAYDYISNIEDYPLWWGKVYKKIIKLKDAPPDQAGAKYAVTVGGFLPYTLTIENEITSIDKPYSIRFNASGDLQGDGTWTFKEIDGGTEVSFDWNVAANKRIIRFFSFLLKPLFKSNHSFCIRKAEEGMLNDLRLCVGRYP